MSGIFGSIEISGSGMSVQRRKMNVVAENIANAETTSTEEGGPYRRRQLEVTADSEKQPFKTILDKTRATLVRTNGRHISGIPSAMNRYERVVSAQAKEVTDDENAFRLVYDPHHPDADADGYVKMPDIEIINEMVDMIAANRAYEANATAISASKEMAKNALNI